jgi:hypothetical protein
MTIVYHASSGTNFLIKPDKFADNLKGKSKDSLIVELHRGCLIRWVIRAAWNLKLRITMI